MTVGSRVMRTCCGRMLKFINQSIYQHICQTDFGGDSRKSWSLLR